MAYFDRRVFERIMSQGAVFTPAQVRVLAEALEASLHFSPEKRVHSAETVARHPDVN